MQKSKSLSSNKLKLHWSVIFMLYGDKFYCLPVAPLSFRDSLYCQGFSFSFIIWTRKAISSVSLQNSTPFCSLPFIGGLFLLVQKGKWLCDSKIEESQVMMYIISPCLCLISVSSETICSSNSSNKPNALSPSIPRNDKMKIVVTWMAIKRNNVLFTTYRIVVNSSGAGLAMQSLWIKQTAHVVRRGGGGGVSGIHYRIRNPKIMLSAVLSPNSLQVCEQQRHA